MPTRTGTEVYRRNRATRLAMSDGDRCAICGHGGVLTGVGRAQVNHIQPHKYGGDDEVENLEPCHGGDNRCATCGRCCNQKLGARVVDNTYSSRDW